MNEIKWTPSTSGATELWEACANGQVAKVHRIRGVYGEWGKWHAMVLDGTEHRHIGEKESLFAAQAACLQVMGVLS